MAGDKRLGRIRDAVAQLREEQGVPADQSVTLAHHSYATRTPTPTPKPQTNPNK